MPNYYLEDMESKESVPGQQGLKTWDRSKGAGEGGLIAMQNVSKL